MIVESIWKHHSFDTADLDAQTVEDVRRFEGFEMPVVKPPEGVVEASSMRGPWTKSELALVYKAYDGRLVRTFRPFPAGPDGAAKFALGDIFLRPGLAQPILEAFRIREDSIPMLRREKLEEFAAAEAGETGLSDQQKILRRIVVLLNGDENDKAKGMVYLLRRFRRLDENSPEFAALVGTDKANPAVGPDVVDYLRRSFALRRKLSSVSSNAILRGRWNSDAAFAEADRAALRTLLSETLRFPFVLESLEAVGHPATEDDVLSVLTSVDGAYGAAEDHFNGAPIVTMRDFESGRLLFEPLTSREIRRPISAMLKSALGIGRQVPVAEVFRRLLQAFVACTIEEDEIDNALGFLAWYALRRPAEAHRTAVEVDAGLTDAATLIVASIPFQRLRLDAEAVSAPAVRTRLRTSPQPASSASEPTETTPHVPALMPEDAAIEVRAPIRAVEAVMPNDAVRAVPAGTESSRTETPAPEESSFPAEADEVVPVSSEDGATAPDPEPTEPSPDSHGDDTGTEDGLSDVPAAARVVMASWETRLRTFLSSAASYASGASVARASDLEADLRTMLVDVAALGDAFASATAPVVVDDLLLRIQTVNEQIFEISGGDTEPLDIPVAGHVHPDRRPDMEAQVAEGESHARSAGEAGRESEEIQASISAMPLSKRREAIGRLDTLTTRILADTTTAWRAIAAALAHVTPAEVPILPVAMATGGTDGIADGELPDFLSADTAEPALPAETPVSFEDAETPARPDPNGSVSEPDTVPATGPSIYPDFAGTLRREAATNGFDAAYAMSTLRPDSEAADMAQEIIQAIVMPGRVDAEKYLHPDVTNIFETAYLRLHDLPVEWRGTGDLLALASLEGAMFNPAAVYTEILDTVDGSNPVAQACWNVHAAIRAKVSSSGIPSAADFKQARGVLAARESMARSRAEALETIEVLRNAQFSYKSAGDHRDALDKGYFADLLRGMDDAEAHRDADPLVLDQARHYSTEKQAGQLLDAIAREEGVSNLERGGRTKFLKAVTDVSKAAIVFLEAAEKSGFDGLGFDELITATEGSRAIVREARPTDPFDGAVLRQAETILGRFHELVTGSARRPE